jgi:XTP/dITP diphosphohydrolase
MKVTFISTNKHKFKEVKDVLKEYPIDLEWLEMKYDEDHEDGIEETAKKAAEKLANELKKPIILEDTGLFFEAYPGFPGPAPKFIFNTLGYKGILKLLDGERRGAYFKTVAAYCKPNEKPVVFEGIMKGHFANEVFNEGKDVMPYDRFFIPEGFDKTISDMTIAEKTAISQRGKAFRAFGEFVKRNEK